MHPVPLCRACQQIGSCTEGGISKLSRRACMLCAPCQVCQQLSDVCKCRPCCIGLLIVPLCRSHHQVVDLYFCMPFCTVGQACVLSRCAKRASKRLATVCPAFLHFCTGWHVVPLLQARQQSLDLCLARLSVFFLVTCLGIACLPCHKSGSYCFGLCKHKGLVLAKTKAIGTTLL